MPSLIGILGGGQLARMLALAGHPLGLRSRILDPAPDSPAAAVADHICADYTDKAALNQFADGLDVITYEFENIPADCIHHLAARVHTPIPIYPPPLALTTGQDRLSEKSLFRSLNIPVAPFADIATLDSLHAAVQTIGLPAILKTRRLGYDGKGQVVLREPSAHAQDSSSSPAPPLELAAAFQSLNPTGRTPLILEGFIPFIAEASMLAVRSRWGDIRTYPLIRNEHKSGILRRSRAPFGPFDPHAPLPPDLDLADLENQAITATTRILEALNYTGVLAVEYFILPTPSHSPHPYTLIASEIAPRVHNSGHWTIEGSTTSQFENHLRAVCGLPLGDTAMRFPGAAASMSNLVGGWPDPQDPHGVLAIPAAHIHLYGKSPRPGRKVGHATVIGPAPDLDSSAAPVQALADASWRS